MPSMNCTLVSKKKSHIKFCLEQPVLEKHFTVAQVIAKHQRPTLVLAHNKTLAAQLYEEFRQLFPDNAVEYFVLSMTTTSPKHTFLPQIITFPKSRRSTSKIDKLRHAATRSLLERRMSSSFHLSHAFMVLAPKKRMMECFSF